MHERVDDTTIRSERGRKVLRGLTVWSDTHGLYGRADAVELESDGTLLPVEHKSGRRMVHATALQLAGQALYLEEMFNKAVEWGETWLAAKRKRVAVAIDEALRLATLDVLSAIRAARTSVSLPAAVFDSRCRDCSLIDECLPQLTSNPRRIATMHGMLFGPLEADGD